MPDKNNCFFIVGKVAISGDNSVQVKSERTLGTLVSTSTTILLMGFNMLGIKFTGKGLLFHKMENGGLFFFMTIFLLKISHMVRVNVASMIRLDWEKIVVINTIYNSN